MPHSQSTPMSSFFSLPIFTIDPTQFEPQDWNSTHTRQRKLQRDGASRRQSVLQHARRYLEGRPLLLSISTEPTIPAPPKRSNVLSSRARGKRRKFDHTHVNSRGPKTELLTKSHVIVSKSTTAPTNDRDAAPHTLADAHVPNALSANVLAANMDEVDEDQSHAEIQAEVQVEEENPNHIPNENPMEAKAGAVARYTNEEPSIINLDIDFPELYEVDTLQQHNNEEFVSNPHKDEHADSEIDAKVPHNHEDQSDADEDNDVSVCPEADATINDHLDNKACMSSASNTAMGFAGNQMLQENEESIDGPGHLHGAKDEEQPQTSEIETIAADCEVADDRHWQLPKAGGQPRTTTAEEENIHRMEDSMVEDSMYMTILSTDELPPAGNDSERVAAATAFEKCSNEADDMNISTSTKPTIEIVVDSRRVAAATRLNPFRPGKTRGMDLTSNMLALGQLETQELETQTTVSCSITTTPPPRRSTRRTTSSHAQKNSFTLQPRQAPVESRAREKAAKRTTTKKSILRRSHPKLTLAQKLQGKHEKTMARMFRGTVEDALRKTNTHLDELLGEEADSFFNAALTGSPAYTEEVHSRLILDTPAVGFKALKPAERKREIRHMVFDTPIIGQSSRPVLKKMTSSISALGTKTASDIPSRRLDEIGVALRNLDPNAMKAANISEEIRSKEAESSSTPPNTEVGFSTDEQWGEPSIAFIIEDVISDNHGIDVAIQGRDHVRAENFVSASPVSKTTVDQEVATPAVEEDLLAKDPGRKLSLKHISRSQHVARQVRTQNSTPPQDATRSEELLGQVDRVQPASSHCVAKASAAQALQEEDPLLNNPPSVLLATVMPAAAARRRTVTFEDTADSQPFNRRSPIVEAQESLPMQSTQAAFLLAMQDFQNVIDTPDKLGRTTESTTVASSKSTGIAVSRGGPVVLQDTQALYDDFAFTPRTPIRDSRTMFSPAVPLLHLSSSKISSASTSFTTPNSTASVIPPAPVVVVTASKAAHKSRFNGARYTPANRTIAAAFTMPSASAAPARRVEPVAPKPASTNDVSTTPGKPPLNADSINPSVRSRAILKSPFMPQGIYAPVRAHRQRSAPWSSQRSILTMTPNPSPILSQPTNLSHLSIYPSQPLLRGSEFTQCTITSATPTLKAVTRSRSGCASSNRGLRVEFLLDRDQTPTVTKRSLAGRGREDLTAGLGIDWMDAPSSILEDTDGELLRNSLFPQDGWASKKLAWNGRNGSA